MSVDAANQAAGSEIIGQPKLCMHSVLREPKRHHPVGHADELRDDEAVREEVILAHGSNPAPAATVTSKAAAKARSSSPAKLATSVPERTDYAPIPYETVTPPDATVTRHRPADRSHLIHSDGLRRRGLLRTRHFAVKLTGFVVTSGTKPLTLADVETATVQEYFTPLVRPVAVAVFPDVVVEENVEPLELRTVTT